MRAVTVADGRVAVARRPVPEPGPGEVRVRVHGAGLNRADLLQRAGRYPAPPGAPADVPGLEFAGVVDACGEGVTTRTPGDRVLGIAGGGAQAEYLAVPATQCAPVPEGLDLVAMGGVPEAFVTAHDALVTQAHLEPGEWALVHAVGSGVGTAALALAKASGCRVVGTARTPEKLRRCEALGLDAGLVPPHHDDGTLAVDALAAEVVRITGDGAHVTLDLLGGPYTEASIAAAAPQGRIVLIGTLAGGRADLPILAVMGKRLTIHGTVLRSRTVEEKSAAVAAFAAGVLPLLAAGTVAPVIDRVVPLDRAHDAYELLASDATFGKVVLACGPDAAAA